VGPFFTFTQIIVIIKHNMKDFMVAAYLVSVVAIRDGGKIVIWKAK
jgi:hypothetical protein